MDRVPHRGLKPGRTHASLIRRLHTPKKPCCPTSASSGFETTHQGGFMLIPIECWSCGSRFHVDARYAGKVGTCPHPECGRKYLVPNPEPHQPPQKSSKPKRRTPPSQPPAIKRQAPPPVPPLPQVSTPRKTYARSPCSFPPAKHRLVEEGERLDCFRAGGGVSSVGGGDVFPANGPSANR